MRHQLEQFEGQLVHFSGYIAKRVQQPDDLHDVCLQSVKVRKFDPTQPVMESKPVTVDHLWLQSLEGDSIYTKELMRKASGIARCRYYTRKNGHRRPWVGVPSFLLLGRTGASHRERKDVERILRVHPELKGNARPSKGCRLRVVRTAAGSGGVVQAGLQTRHWQQER